MSNLTAKERNELQTLIETLSKEDVIDLVKNEYANREIGSSTLGRLFEIIAEPDENGYSRKVYMDELMNVHHNFKSDGGNQWARTNKNYLGTKYEIERGHNEVCPDGNKYLGVSSIQLVGFNHNEIETCRAIRKDIVDYYKKQKCCVLDVISSHGMECDHKDGKYNNVNNLSTSTQRVEDFQCMSKAVNNAKRQHCKVCKDTKKRYDATLLGYKEAFIIGDENSDFCNGCYWYDPKEFNRVISKDFENENN